MHGKYAPAVNLSEARPVGMGLSRAAWVELNLLRTGVGRSIRS